ncbi:autotransporter outer membrane beta-barrel domain-containing protein [Proteus terrae]|uniref:autotransporter outer membrane beta-barrel domain-containing protein n=1 Tax=Proteus terrae TaxID=1574161 RepID=UPI0034E52496
MNHIYKLIWCMASNCFIVVSELAKGNKKSISCTKKKSLLSVALISILPVSTSFAVENEVPLNISGKNQQVVNTSKISNVNIINNITIEKIGNGKHAIEAVIDNTTSTGNISIKNTGNLKTNGNHAFGIFAENKDVGDIKIEHSGNISTNGLASHGIYAKSDADGASQKINIDVKKSNIMINDSLATNDNEIAYHVYAEQDNIQSGDVNINVSDSKLSGISGDYGSTAVYIKSKSDKGNLLATLNNTDISLDGFNADGVHLVNLSDTSAGDITIETNSGSIVSKNSEGNVEYNYALFGNQKGKNATGDIRITNNATNITTGSKDNDNGRGAIGIHALFDSQTASGDIVIDNKGNINTLAKGDMNNGIYTNNAGTGNILISNTGNITTNGTASSAIHSQQDNVQAKKDSVNQISNSGKLETLGNYSSGITLIKKNAGKVLVNNEGDAVINGSFSHGIYLDTQGGDIQVQSSKGDITTSGDTSHGIFVNNKSAADNTLVINNSSNISTTGARTGSNNSAAAIRVTQEGDGKINLTNSGNISTKGIEARNIYINALGNSAVEVNNSGSLTSENSSAVGIYSQGDVLITNTGNISAKNKADSKQEVSGHGIEGISRTGNINIQHLAGDITVENNAQNQQSHGIVAGGGTNTEVARSADILIGSKANIDATQGNSAVFLKTVKEGSVNINQGATVKGGNDAGVHFEVENGGTGDYAINNAGFISAKSDKAINVVGSDANSQLSLTNSGTLQGVVNANNKTALNLENTGTFLVRNQNNETKNVAISHFNNGTINNTGTIKLLAVDGINSNTTGEYVPHGTLSSASSGIVHGQLLGVKDFNHSGVLDLTGAGLSGNSFVISGGQVAGQNGNGTFTTNGGTLKMATTLNEGGQESRSDVLVVDNLKKGNDATKIDIVIASGSKEIATKENGIQLVKTLGTQDADAFELAGPVTYGRYEYLLYDGDASGVNDGYYLRNQLKKTDEKIPNPNVGAYLGNQYAAANMFNQNILDRRDNVQAPDQTVWARINYNQVKTDHIRDTQELQIDSTLLQIGADFYRDEEKGRVAGAYVGYGYSDVENRSRLTGTKAEGDVKGVQLGAYYSWMPEKDNGPYVDVWGHFAHYNNKLKGQAQKNQDRKYDSYGFAVSTEGGYSFIVEENDVNKWVLKPHVQLTYNYIDADDFTDHNNTRFSHNKSEGVQTRLGARFYGNKQQPKGLLPFVEANWLYNGMDNEVVLNGDKESSDIGKNIGELKIGLQGNVNDSSSLFIHFNVQKGSHDYQQIGGQIGYNYNW